MASLKTSLRFNTQDEAHEWLERHGYVESDTDWKHGTNGTFAKIYDSGEATLSAVEKRYRVRIFAQ